jgi:hypothetical protein
LTMSMATGTWWCACRSSSRSQWLPTPKPPGSSSIIVLRHCLISLILAECAQRLHSQLPI